VTVLIVSHSNDQIERLCNKVIWIEKGHTRLMGKAEDICRIYRGLGGREGSADSEQRIFEVLKKEKTIPDDAYSVVDGDDFYETSVQAATLIWKNRSVDTVAIACGVTHINTVFANGLAGAYDAPVLQTKTDRIPFYVRSFLTTHKPKRILFFDWESDAALALKELRRLEWQPEIVEFSQNGNAYDMSTSVFSHGKDHALWGSSAVILDFADNSESLAAAPYVYKERCPVFVSRGAASFNTEELLKILVENDFKKVILIGKTADPQILASCEEAHIETQRIAAEESYQSCLEICDWLFDADNKKKELCVASLSLSQWSDILMCGAYCAHKNAALLLEDPTNLDSIATCLDWVSRNKSKIKSLTFFGGKANLNESDRELLCNELFSSK